MNFGIDRKILKKADNIRKNCTKPHNLRVYLYCILCYNADNKRVKKNISALIDEAHIFITIL